jgi:hypothetical protein
MSIDTASMDSAPSGSSSKNAFRVSVSLPGLPQMILPVSWSLEFRSLDRCGACELWGVCDVIGVSP